MTKTGSRASERAMPGSVAARGDRGWDQQQGRAGREHVDLENSGQTFDDDLEIEGQGHEAGALDQSDEAGRDSEESRAQIPAPSR